MPADSWSIEIDRTDRTDPAERQRTDDQIGAIRSPNEVVVVRDSNGSITIGDKASITTSRRAGELPPKSAAELDRALQAVGRGSGVLTSGTAVAAPAPDEEASAGGQ